MFSLQFRLKDISLRKKFLAYVKKNWYHFKFGDVEQLQPPQITKGKLEF